jgi:repressor LexA
MPPELTVKQQRLLGYLERENHRRGRTPSLRQAAADLGVSHAAVAQTLKALETKGVVRREGRYSRTVQLLGSGRKRTAPNAHRSREVPVIGRIRAGLPMYAQQEWDESVVVDAGRFPGARLFALRVKGDSMQDAGILDGDLAICEPRQYARNGEIVVALIDQEEATVKRFYRSGDQIELHPANRTYAVMRYTFEQILIQGKVVGIQRDRIA